MTELDHKSRSTALQRKPIIHNDIACNIILMVMMTMAMMMAVMMMMMMMMVTNSEIPEGKTTTPRGP